MEAKQTENICHAMEGQLKRYSNATFYSTHTLTHTHLKGYITTPIHLMQAKKNLPCITEKLILTQIYIRGQYSLETPP